MKKLILNSIGLSLLLCSTIYLNAKNHTLSFKKNSVHKSVCVTKDCKIEKCIPVIEIDIRIKKGQRKQCGPKDKEICCGSKFCAIVIITRPDPIPPMTVINIFEGEYFPLDNSIAEKLN